ncbi:MAG: glycosyltransferase [bacterium]|nr:glycosyltransferase [bacterium]
MSQSVAVVIPSLADFELLERCLPLVLAELEARDVAGDEVLVVDDTGEAVLGAWIEERCPNVRVVACEANVGFGPALLKGAEAAEAEHLFAMNPDVVPRPGFLSPLASALADSEVAVASPRVLLQGEESRIESHSALRVEDGSLRVVERRPESTGGAVRPVAFAVGGAMLVRREEFVRRGGFDPLFAPFYFEDTDLGIDEWRAGLRVVEVPEAVVEHHHRGTIGARVPEELVQAAIEKNRYLLYWKYLDSRRDAHDHLAAIWRDALDAGVAGRREELVWMALALEELSGVHSARKALRARVRPFGEVLRVADPLA